MRIILCVILLHAALAMARKLPISTGESHFNIFNPSKLETFITELMYETKISDFLNSDVFANGKTTNDTVEQRDDMELLQDDNDLRLEQPPKSKSAKKEKDGNLMIPILVGFKVTAFVVGVVSFIGLLILKAFIASKAALIIALTLGLKKLFGEHEKPSHEKIHAPLHFEPEYHYEDAKFGDKHTSIQQGQEHIAQKFSGSNVMPEQKALAFLAEHPEANLDLETFESQILQESPDSQLNGNSNAPHQDHQQFTHEDLQKRRNWKASGKRKGVNIVKGHPQPVIAYRKAVTGRNL